MDTFTKMMEEVNTRTTYFWDVAGWSALRRSDGKKGQAQSYWIRNFQHKTVAFLSVRGNLCLTGPNGDTGKPVRRFKFKSTGTNCDNDIQLKQAVRYAYLLLQRPVKSKRK